MPPTWTTLAVSSIIAIANAILSLLYAYMCVRWFGRSTLVLVPCKGAENWKQTLSIFKDYMPNGYARALYITFIHLTFSFIALLSLHSATYFMLLDAMYIYRSLLLYNAVRALWHNVSSRSFQVIAAAANLSGYLCLCMCVSTHSFTCVLVLV